MNRIPALPKKMIYPKMNSDERYLAWHTLIRKLENPDEVIIYASKIELGDFLGEFATSEIFVVDYRIYLFGEPTTYGVHFYFMPFNKVCAILVYYRVDENEQESFDMRVTPLKKWENYSEDHSNASIDTDWEGAYELLLECLDYFKKIELKMIRQKDTST